LLASLNVKPAAATNACGSGNPSPWLYSARAPIHPKRPYGLTRPVVPPDGSLIWRPRPHRRRSKLKRRWTSKKLLHNIIPSRLVDSLSLRLASVSTPAGWSMTHRLGVANRRDLFARWCALAEQRLEYLSEMFESGRWRRFYSEGAFLENVREAKIAVETWRELSAPASIQGSSAVALALSVPAQEPRLHSAGPPPMPVAREPLNEPLAAHAVRGVEGQPALDRALHNPVAAPGHCGNRAALSSAAQQVIRSDPPHRVGVDHQLRKAPGRSGSKLVPASKRWIKVENRAHTAIDLVANSLRLYFGGVS
jgi:uncharacterized repeat protein (TIGR03809 family)